MEAQYRSINRGGNSIFDKIREAGHDPNEYISFWNLRSYDRINAPQGAIKKMEAASGVSFHEAQVALARLYVGEPGGDSADEDEVVYIEKPHDQTTAGDATNQKKKTAEDSVKLPRTIADAQEIIDKFTQAAVRDDSDMWVFRNPTNDADPPVPTTFARTPWRAASRALTPHGPAPKRRSVTAL